jgi:hypothetical protein
VFTSNLPIPSIHAPLIFLWEDNSMRHVTFRRLTMRGIATLAIIALFWQTCQAVPVMVFTDTFNTVASIPPVTSETEDVNFQVGSPRQTGSLAPISFVDTDSGPGGYHTQVNTSITPQQLLIFGDSTQLQPKVSPNFNFSGVSPSGIIGKRMTVSFNVGNAGTVFTNSYLEAGLTIGASAPLTSIGSASPNFGLRFIEDTFVGSNLGNFFQVYDGATLVANLESHTRDVRRIDLALDINDPIDGNPWDGVGSTQIDVFVNNILEYSLTKGGGGYTSNFTTFMASANGVGAAAQAHNFDNLVVFAAAVPEASSLLCGAALSVVAGLTWIRTRRG